jgi:hypothetical protein
VKGAIPQLLGDGVCVTFPSLYSGCIGGLSEVCGSARTRTGVLLCPSPPPPPPSCTLNAGEWPPVPLEVPTPPLNPPVAFFPATAVSVSPMYNLKREKEISPEGLDMPFRVGLREGSWVQVHMAPTLPSSNHLICNMTASDCYLLFLLLIRSGSGININN